MLKYKCSFYSIIINRFLYMSEMLKECKKKRLCYRFIYMYLKPKFNQTNMQYANIHISSFISIFLNTENQTQSLLKLQLTERDMIMFQM